MSSEIQTSWWAGMREFPERILVVDVAGPRGKYFELTVVSEKDDWGDLPHAFYVREDGETTQTTE